MQSRQQLSLRMSDPRSNSCFCQASTDPNKLKLKQTQLHAQSATAGFLMIRNPAPSSSPQIVEALGQFKHQITPQDTPPSKQSHNYHAIWPLLSLPRMTDTGLEIRWIILWRVRQSALSGDQHRLCVGLSTKLQYIGITGRKAPILLNIEK